MYKDNSRRTAIKRTRVSRPVQSLTRFFTGTILDYGGGRGFDAKMLKADIYDPFFFPERLNGIYDTVLLNYVVNVILEKGVRIQVVGEALKRLKPGGTFIITSRTPGEIQKLAKSGWTECSDGFLTGANTFQKGHSIEELRELVQANSKDMQLLYEHSGSDYTALVCTVGGA